MDILDFIPAALFEIGGVAVGSCGVLAISVQIRAEWHNTGRSTLSRLSLLIWLLIFFFWALYGLRFRLLAVGIPNTVAALLQAVLLTMTWHKNR